MAFKRSGVQFSPAPPEDTGTSQKSPFSVFAAGGICSRRLFCVACSRGMLCRCGEHAGSGGMRRMRLLTRRAAVTFPARGFREEMRERQCAASECLLSASSLRIREHTPDAPGEGCAGMGTQADAAYRVPRCALIRQPHLAALEPERIRIQGTGALSPTARRGACLSARRRPVRSCGRNGRARPRGGPGRPAAGAHRAVAVRCPRAARVQCSGPGRVVRNAA